MGTSNFAKELMSWEEVLLLENILWQCLNCLLQWSGQEWTIHPHEKELLSITEEDSKAIFELCQSMQWTRLEKKISNWSFCSSCYPDQLVSKQEKNDIFISIWIQNFLSSWFYIDCPYSPLILAVFRPIWLFSIFSPFLAGKNGEYTLGHCFRAPLNHPTSVLVCICIHIINTFVWKRSSVTFVARLPLLCGQVKWLKRPYSPLMLSTKVDLKQVRPTKLKWVPKQAFCLQKWWKRLFKNLLQSKM